MNRETNCVGNPRQLADSSSDSRIDSTENNLLSMASDCHHGLLGNTGGVSLSPEATDLACRATASGGRST